MNPETLLNNLHFSYMVQKKAFPLRECFFLKLQKSFYDFIFETLYVLPSPVA